jgi:hypothetical protein
VNAILTGRIDARTAREASYALAQFRLGADKADLARRVRDLERRLKAFTLKTVTR